MIPAVIKDGNLFVEGRGFAGKFKSLKPPKIAIATEEFNSGGMVAPMDIDMGLEKLEASFVLHEWTKEVLIQFGVVNHAGVGFRAAYAAERDDASEELQAINMVMRGRIKELDFPDFERGKEQPLNVGLTLTYFRYEVDGQPLIEIDTVNMVYKVNGVDRYAARRDAIGVN